MKTFIVAYISYFDNILTQERIEAENAIDAMCQVLISKKGYLSDMGFKTEEDVKFYAFDSDSMVSAFELE